MEIIRVILSDELRVARWTQSARTSSGAATLDSPIVKASARVAPSKTIFMPVVARVAFAGSVGHFKQVDIFFSIIDLQFYRLWCVQVLIHS